MTLVRWRPLRDVVGIRDDMDRLFHNFFGPEWNGTTLDSPWQPSMDLAENENDVVITAELPGIGKEDVKLSMQDNVLVIRGEKKQERTEKDESFHRVERSYGTFQRSIVLPTAVDSKKIKAHFNNGVLKITLPKAEEAKRKEIPISVN